MSRMILAAAAVFLVIASVSARAERWSVSSNVPPVRVVSWGDEKPTYEELLKQLEDAKSELERTQQQLEAAYIHAPYVPLLMTDTILSPDDFTPRKAILSRYAKHLVEDGQYYYAVLNVQNLFSANGAGGTIFGGVL